MKITLSNIKFSGTCEINEESYRVTKANKNLASLKNALNDQYLKKVDKELLPTTRISFKTNENATFWRSPGKIETATIEFNNKNDNFNYLMITRGDFLDPEDFESRQFYGETSWNIFISYMLLLRSITIGESHKKFVERVFKKAKALERNQYNENNSP